MGAQFEPFSLTPELLNGFLQSQIEKGCKRDTIRKYRMALEQLHDFLPPDEALTPEALERWQDRLKEEGYSAASIQNRVSVVNSLLRYLGYGGLATREPAGEKTAMPVPTRKEYLRFLTAVRNGGREQDYLLVKVFASIDIRVRELPLLTVEACGQGYIPLSQGKKAPIPTALRRELLGYAGRNDIHSGPVFVTRTGQPLDRANIAHTIHDLAENAGMEPEKFCPSALHRMYQNTWNELQESLLPLCMQAYDNLLDMEQAVAGW